MREIKLLHDSVKKKKKELTKLNVTKMCDYDTLTLFYFTRICVYEYMYHSHLDN